MSATRSQGGFTLIELVVAVTVVGILMAIAIPSYQAQMVRTRRAEGRALITQVAARLERCYTRFSAYDHASCIGTVASSSENGWYRVPADGGGATDSNIDAQAFTLRAIPQRTQARDDTDCATLTLTHVGVKGQTGTGVECW